MSASGDGVRRHVLSRWPVMLGGVGLLAGSGAWAMLPPHTEVAVVALLERDSAGAVAADEYVWEPSNGWFDDLFRGRGVVFLSRAEATGTRDAFRARVRVTPGGRPLSSRGCQRLTDSAFADEADLFVAGSYAAFSSKFNGKFQSVSIVRLAEGSPTWGVALPRPIDRVELEIQGEQLIVEWDGKASVFDLPGERLVAGVPLPLLEIPGVVDQVGAVASAPTSFLPTSQGGDAFPPAGFSDAYTLAPGRPSAIAKIEGANVSGLALDGRQLRFVVLPGTILPRTATGFYYDGDLPPDLRGKTMVAAIPIPTRASANAGGAFVNGSWIAPFTPDSVAVGATPKGELTIGAWGLSAWELPLSASAAVEWAGGTSGNGRHALCVTPEGNLAIVWGKAADDDVLRSALPKACAFSLAADGVLEGVKWGREAASLDLSRPLIAAWAVDVAPSVAAPEGTQWRPADKSLPHPAFLPAIHQLELESLGATITISHVDPSRFDWRILAGSDERSHRHKGTFQEKLPEADAGRAKLAISLGTGKRKRPRGLRIAGSTGHVFSQKEALLTVGARFVSLALSGAAFADGDASELPLTVSGGELASAARERGPLQARADMCVLSDGHLLIAEAVFDSHEATAGALVSLGCETAVALDRGSERSSWRRADAEAAGPFETSALVALERPLIGAARAGGWQPPKGD